MGLQEKFWAAVREKIKELCNDDKAEPKIDLTDLRKKTSQCDEQHLNT